jgi:hypothetical protein
VHRVEGKKSDDAGQGDQDGDKSKRSAGEFHDILLGFE